MQKLSLLVEKCISESNWLRQGSFDANFNGGYNYSISTSIRTVLTLLRFKNLCIIMSKPHQMQLFKTKLV